MVPTRFEAFPCEVAVSRIVTVLDVRQCPLTLRSKRSRSHSPSDDHGNTLMTARVTIREESTILKLDEGSPCSVVIDLTPEERARYGELAARQGKTIERLGRDLFKQWYRQNRSGGLYTITAPRGED